MQRAIILPLLGLVLILFCFSAQISSATSEEQIETSGNIPVRDEPRRDERSDRDEFGYNWLDGDEATGPSFRWTEISDEDNRLNAGDDWNSGPLDLGWSFEYYGVEYESIRVCDNGLISFTSNSTERDPFELPSAEEPFNILAAQWVDLNPREGGNIYFLTDPDEEIAVVSWINIPVYAGGDETEQMFQIILHGDDDAIVFQYADNQRTGRMTCIGIQNGDGSIGLNIAFSEFIDDESDLAPAGRAIGIGCPWIEYPDSAGMLLDKESINFGQLLLEHSKIDSINITNNGRIDLEIEDITSSDEAFTLEEIDFPIVLESKERWTFDIEFEPQDYDDFNGDITIHSNAQNGDDGEIVIPVTGDCPEDPQIITLDPAEISTVLNSNETSESEITIGNTGGCPLYISGTRLEIESMPEQGFHLPGVVESRFALFAENIDPWNRDYDLRQIFDSIENLEYEHFDNFDDFEDVTDFSEFDIIWIANGQSEEFLNDYSAKLSAIEDFVDRGGVYYMCTGDLNSRIEYEHPGGLCPTKKRIFEGVTALSSINNYLFYLMGWNEVRELTGFSYSVYSNYRLARIENSYLDPVILVRENKDNGNGIPIVVAYDYGSGFCMVSGALDGLLHNEPERFDWGRTGPSTLRYLDYLHNLNRWLTWIPYQDTVDAEDETELTVTLDAANYAEGEYNAHLHIYSNDIEHPDTTISIDLQIIGIPEISVSWSADYGYPDVIDFNAAYGFTCNNHSYDLPLTIHNSGSSILNITDAEISSQYFNVEFNEEEGIDLNPCRDTVITVTFSPIESDDYYAELILSSNDPENEEYSINLFGGSCESPQIVVDPAESIEMEIPEGGINTENLLVLNEGEADLHFRIEHDFVSGPDRDDMQRVLRNVNSITLPKRDLLYGRYAVFQVRGDWGFYSEVWLDQIDVEYDSYTRVGDIGNIDLSEYQAIIVAGNRQGAGFHSACRNNLAWFEEYIDNGGVMYLETGGSAEFTFEAPGHIRWEFGLDANGVVVVNGEENFLISQMEWENGHVLLGNYFLYSNFQIEQFNELIDGGDSDWYQVIVEGQSSHNPGVVAYNFGDGAVVIAGCLIATQWQSWDDEGQWGSAREEMLRYMLSLGRTSWLGYSPWNGVITENQDETITLRFNAQNKQLGDYEAVLNIITNDPDQALIEIDIILTVQAAPDILVSWSDEAGYPDVMDFSMVYEELLPDEEYLLPFRVSNDGSLQLVLSQFMFDSENFSVNFDDEVSLDAGDIYYDTLKFSYADEDLYHVFHALMTISSNDPDDEESETEIRAERDIPSWELILQAGWSMVSLNMWLTHDLYADGEERGPDLPLMFDPLKELIILIKNGMGNFWLPEWDYNRIDYWNYEEGYLIKMTMDTSITWYGVPIPAQSDISLEDGWNMIAYFPDYPLDASDPDFFVLSPIIDHVLLAKDEQGYFLVPEFNYSNMPPWIPQHGYKVRVDNDVVLNYPFEPEERASSVEFTDYSILNGHWQLTNRSGENMSVLVTSFDNLTVGDGDQIGAFSSSGSLVGVGFVRDGQCGIAVWGDDPQTEAVEGLIEGEAFELKLWDNRTETTSVVIASQIHRGRGLLYENDNIVILDIKTVASVPSNYYLSQNYPNPFNSITRITYGLREAGRVSIRVLDIQGRLVEELVNTNQAAGDYSLLWNAGSFASGFYFISMQSNSFHAVRKSMLIR
ncbi:T9SS type A sorting domain-containing protein [bacterium]|nr:T9SS type A sorting domain-containing protein [bacterium]